MHPLRLAFAACLLLLLPTLPLRAQETVMQDATGHLLHPSFYTLNPPPAPSWNAITGKPVFGTAPGNVPVVGSDGKLSPAILPPGATSGVPAGQTLVVDALNGNAATATRGDANKPFATLAAAVAAAQAGDVVEMRPGDYPYPGVLTLDKAGLTIRGNGARLLPAPGETAFQKVGVTAAGCKLYGLEIAGSYNGSVTVDNGLVELNNAPGTLIENCYIHHGATGVRIISNSGGTRVIDCNISDNFGAIFDSNYSPSNHNQYRGNRITYSAALDAATTNGSIRAALGGIRVSAHGTPSDDTLIEGNSIDIPAGLAIEVWGGNTNVRTVGNHISRGDFGISYDNVQRGVIAHNTVHASYLCIELASLCADVVVDGNVCDGRFVDAQNNPYYGATGVSISNTAGSNLVISNNRIRDTHIGVGTNVPGSLITGNHLTGIWDMGVKTLETSKVTIHGNFIEAAKNGTGAYVGDRGIRAQDDNDLEITNNQIIGFVGTPVHLQNTQRTRLVDNRFYSPPTAGPDSVVRYDNSYAGRAPYNAGTLRGNLFSGNISQSPVVIYGGYALSGFVAEDNDVRMVTGLVANGGVALYLGAQEAASVGAGLIVRNNLGLGWANEQPADNPSLDGSLVFQTTHAGSGNLYSYATFYAGASFAVQSGDTLEYWIRRGGDSPAASDKGSGIGLVFSDGTQPYNYGGLFYPNVSLPTSRWVRQQVPLAALVGKTVTGAKVFEESDGTGTYTTYYHRVRIVRGGQTALDIWRAGTPQTFATAELAGASGVSLTPFSSYVPPATQAAQGTMSAADKAKLDSVTPGSGGSYKRTIVVPAGGQASIAFTSIPSGYNNLRVEFAGSIASGAVELAVRLNGDTASNYSYVESSNLTGSYQSSSTDHGRIGTIVAGSTTAASMRLPQYSGSTLAKTLVAQSSDQQSGVDVRSYGSAWTGTAPINALSIFPTASTFAAGTTTTLILE